MSKKTINRIYPTYDEKLVKSTVLYANAGEGEKDGVLYFDEAYEYPVDTNEAFNLFLKGMIIVYVSNYFRPYAYRINTDGAAEISIMDGTDEIALLTVVPTTE